PLISCRITLSAGTRPRRTRSMNSDADRVCSIQSSEKSSSEGDIYSCFFVGIIYQASASPVLETILERRLQRVKESGKGGRAVVRIRGVTDDVAAAFVRLLYAGSRYRERCAPLLFPRGNCC
uniref:Uncharacterized protein n=1 Tax=Aegilops tauschii subsp. strangulata TaxID=200361 RepID=A0A453G8P5_AEGTS